MWPCTQFYTPEGLILSDIWGRRFRHATARYPSHFNQKNNNKGKPQMFVKRLFPLCFLRVLYVIVAKMPTILLWEVRDEGLSHYNYWEENCIYHYYMMHVTLKKIHREISERLPIFPNRRNNIYSHCSNETKEAIHYILLVLHHRITIRMKRCDSQCS